MRNFVTRTFNKAEVTAMVVNKTTGEVTDKTYVLAKPIKDEAKLTKAIEKIETNPDLKVVAVRQVVIVPTTMAMTEADFIAHAKPIEELK